MNDNQIREPQAEYKGEENCEKSSRPQVVATTLDVKPKIRPISIEELDRGYIVRVGCQSFAISTTSGLIAKLSEYIKNPNQTEKAWFDGSLFH